MSTDGDEENASPPSEDWMKKREEVCKKHNVMPEEEDAANQLDHVITYLQVCMNHTIAFTAFALAISCCWELWCRLL